MGPMMRGLAESLRFTHYAMNLVTSDLDPPDALRRLRGGKGPSIAWIIGHLMHYRCLIVKLLGTERPSSYAEKFGVAGASDGSDYPSLSDLKAQWDSLHAEVEKVIESVSDQQLLERQGGGGPHGERTVLQALTFYVWHEAYHMGALGTIRVELGYPSTAERAIAAARATA